MPQRDQVGHHLAHRAFFVEDHADAAAAQFRRDVGVGNAELAQALHQTRVVGQRRRQHQAVGARVLDELVDMGEELAFAVGHRRQHQVVVMGDAGVEHAGLHFHQIVARRVVVEQRDQERTLAGEAARRGIRAVLQFARGGFDALAGLLADVRFLVEYARDGLHRHARRFRYIFDAYSHDRSFPLPRVLRILPECAPNTHLSRATTTNGFADRALSHRPNRSEP